MNNWKIQVVCMNKKGYLLEHKNFDLTELNKLEQYISYKIIDANINKIEITKWNEEGDSE